MNRLLSVALLLALAGVAFPTAHPPDDGLSASVAIDGILLSVDADALRPGVQSCTSVSSGTAFDVNLVVEGVEDLGGFQFDFVYDGAVVNIAAQATVDGGLFLGSAGGSILNLSETAPDSDGRYTTAAADLNKTGPDGSGVLVVEYLQAVGSGSALLRLDDLRFGDISDPPLPLAISIVNPAEVRVDGAPCGAELPPTPAPTPSPTPMPTAAPTTTAPSTPPAVTPTEAVAPLAQTSSGVDGVYLIPGCNPVASTYADDTAIQTIADAVSPAGILVSIWEFDRGAWLGFDPRFPEVSDLSEADHLDVVFLCATSAGSFVRPLV